MVLTTKAIETSLDKLVKEFSGDIGVITENNVGLNVGLNVALCNKFNETLKLEIYQEDNKVLFKAPLAYYGEFNADDVKFVHLNKKLSRHNSHVFQTILY